MAKLVYGSQRQVSFHNLNDYYFALGFLANSRNAELRWENNEDQGAWGSEGRIHCLVPQSRFPQFFRFTAGRGNIYARINCNEYVATLVRDHNFNYNSKYQNVQKILETVPETYLQDFQNGFGSKVNYVVTPSISAASRPTAPSSKAHSSTSNLTPKPTTKPEIKKVPVAVGEKLQHKAYGVGTVYEVEGNYIRIEFSKVGKKSFVNPDSFNGGFLKKINN